MVKTTVRGQEVAGGEQDTEITLGVGALLGLFLTLVVLCGISLGIGFLLGRNSMKPATAGASAAANATAQTPANPAPMAQSQPGADAAPEATGKPTAAQAQAAPPPADLTFYQSVQEKDPQPKLTPPEPPAPAKAVAETHPAVAPGSLGAGYLVQIAAVRFEIDANLLGDTLRKQRYPVLVSHLSDNLYHVQVGPYADEKEAKDILSRLVAAGYNAFLKH
jgi:cell division septation protein DedD